MKVTLFILLILAFIFASVIAFLFNSTPTTFFAYLLAKIEIVPTPQYASITISLFLISAFSKAKLYSFSIPRVLIWKKDVPEILNL